MRRFLLLTIATLMTISMMAIGAGNGKDKANAIDFNWAEGHTHEAGSALWYRVTLAHLGKEANDPTLALYLTNLTTELSNVSLSVDAEVMGQKASKNSSYKIASKGYEIWSLRTVPAAGKDWTLRELMSLGLNEVYVKLQSDKQIKLTAKAYKTEDIVDDACKNAVDFNWNGETVKAGEKWFLLNLSEVKNSDKQLKFVVTNKGAASAKVAFDMSLDCPASAVIEKDWVIAAGAKQEDEFGRVFLDVLKEDYVFLKLTTDQPLTLAVEEVVVLPPPPGKYDSFVCDAPVLKFDEELNLTAGEHVYKVLRQDLIAARDYAYDFHVINNNSTAAKLLVETAFACPVKSAVEQTLTVGAQEEVAVGIKGNVLASVESEWVYIRMTAEQDLTAYIGVRNTNPCANAVPFDWTTGASLQAGESQWYEMDITSLKQNKQHLKLNLVNHSNERAIVSLEMALDCGGTILPLTLPIPAGLNISQVIDYQVIARSPLNKIYLSVSTNAHIELAAGVKNYIAEDQTPCLNAVEVERGVEYEHKPGTQWYDVSLDLLWSKANYSSIYLANKGNKTAHVTIGAVTSCKYTTGTTITLPIPAGLELGALAPNVLGKLIEELVQFEKASNKVEAANVYLEITADQPLEFGLDVINETTSPCLREDLVTFDWNKGARIQAGTPVWYDVDLTTIKNSGKHVKLTFTNHTDSLVWAATVVSVDCPAKLTMPLILPVPAGMSIDKFIDYQYFAVPNVDNIYVGVVADGVLEMAATTYDAVITPSTDCLNAVEVTSNFKYTQSAGTQWYKFPMGLFNDGGHVGKVSFRNLGAETATLTAGVTVGCEYAIPTYGKVKMPKELAFSLAIPTSILAKARKFIDADITEFYMQLTSNQDIVVALNMDASDLKACSSAIPFDWSNWEKNGLHLQANQDIWYEVNLRYPWEKMKKGEDLVLAITNNNNVSVDFEAALSPTCPVFFALESYATIPANVTAQQVIEFSKLAEFLKQFDRELYNDETALIIEKYNAYVVLNKIDAKLGQYGKYFPVSKLETILDQYGKYVAYAELKNLIDNREKYLSKAEIKSRLEEAKELLKDKAQETLSIDQAIQVIDKLDAYIPYVEAETILKNYDQFLPYAAGAVTLLKKCEKYIPTDEIKQIVVKAKNAIPMDKIRALFDKIEARLPRDLNCYMRIKTTGDIIVEPDTVVPAPEGCEDAIEYVWGTDVVVNEEAWYKVSIADVRNKDCSIMLTVTNNSADSVKADLSLYENCDDDQAFLTMKNVGIASNTTRSKTISASELPGDIDVLYLYVQPYGEMTINLSTDCPVFKYEYATVASYACGTEVLTWKDTVHVNKYLDSVYTYVVTPFGAPIQMTQAILDTIAGATPVLTPGTTPDMTASAEAIKAFYLAQDTEALADVVKVEWTATDIACGATTHTMTLTIEDACGNVQTADYTFDVTTPALQVIDTTVTICASELPYTWKGATYPTDGTHTTIIPNVYGCDSAQLTLTINLYPAIPETVVDTTICASEIPYVWNGETYYNSEQDTVVLAGDNGCDSVVILNLTVLPEIVTYDTVTVCYGQPYYWAEAGFDCKRNDREYQATLSSIHGCDSVVYLYVKGLPKVVKESATVDTICDAQLPYMWRDSSYNAIGIYYDTLRNYLGCDSIIYTLDLTVEPKTITSQTITDYVCDGTEYVDPVTGDKHIISSLIPSTQTWTYTVPVSVCEDVVYTYQITPIVAPEVMTDTTLTAIAAVPVLTQGALPNVAGTLDAIKTYYQGKDDESIADVDSIYWTEASLNTVLCGATTHTMTLVVEAGCDNKITTTHTFDVQPIVGTTDTVETCDSYFWNDSVYTETGIHTYVGKTVYGCDSVATLHLTINKSFAVDTVATACDVFEWYGQICDTTGVYTYNGTTAAGCDSVVTLDLTINKSYAVDTVATACDVFEWYGQICDTTGVYTYNGTTAAGCDSVVTLDLTINKSYAVDTIATACDEFVWYGQICDTTGVYTHNGTTVAGCDSVVTLYLTINKSVRVDVYEEYCDSCVLGGTTFTDDFEWEEVLQTKTGCDSIVAHHVTIHHSTITYEAVENGRFCSTYQWRGNTYSDPGTYFDTINDVHGCPSVIYTLNLELLPQAKEVITDTTICYGETVTWVDGETYDATKVGVSYSKPFVGTTCDSVIYTLNLTVLPQAKEVVTDTTICYGETVTWVDGKVYDSTKKGVSHSVPFAGTTCDSVIYTLNLIVLPQTKEVVTDTTICYGETITWVDGKMYDSTKMGVSHSVQYAGTTCDSVIYTLNLTVLPQTKEVVTDTTICYGETITWVDGQMYDSTIKGVSYGVPFKGMTCDSVVYTLNLTVLPDVVYEPTETDYFCPGSTYDWRGHTFDASGTYYDTIYNALGCASVIYTLELVQYVNTLPVVTVDDIVAVCGKAVDVALADAIVKAHIASEALYAPNADVKWYVLSGNTYEELTNTAIDGTVTEVTLKYTVTTDCGVVESDPITVQVQTPSPENDNRLADVPAYNKYGGRLLTVDVKYIKDTLGLEIAADEVTWYLENGANDIEQGKGFYLTTEDGEPLPAGQYYAQINYLGKTAGECDVVLRTIILVVETQVGPSLAPTVAQPNELIRLLNLDASVVSTISIYSSTGQQLESFQIKDANETSFKAAHVAGYYIVEVQTESGKVSLRYVVK